MNHPASTKTLPLTRRLWKDYIREHLRALILASVFMVCASVATSAQPLLIQKVFDQVFKQRDEVALVVVPCVIIVVFAVQGIALYVANLLVARVSNRMMAKMRKALFLQVIHNDVEFYSRNDSGSILARMVYEIVHIVGAVGHFFNAWCRQAVTAAGLLAVMIYQSPQLTLISMGGFLIAFLPLRRITVRLKKLNRQVNDHHAHFNSRLIESLNGIRTVKAFRKEAFEVDKISSYVDDIEEFTNKTIVVSQLTAPLMQVMGGFAVAFVIWYGGGLLMQGTMTEGNLAAFISSLLLLTRPVRSLSATGGVMVKGYVAAERFFDMIDFKPHQAGNGSTERLAITKADIVFDGVSFSYTPEAQALCDASLIFAAGKKTALVGHSGSGKTTIFNLLMKFYEPTHGRILIDGQSLARVSIDSVRAQIALVSQDIFIFDDTALNNIGYGREGASRDDVVEAAKAAHCHEFIMQLPQGYDTKLGYAGEALSGGQKQRIAIARAFLRDAPILLMDEATSALDPRTESDIQDSLARLCHGRTTIVIAHRLSTVIDADQMVLMHEGMVAATGTHAELMQHSELYRRHFGL